MNWSGSKPCMSPPNLPRSVPFSDINRTTQPSLGAKLGRAAKDDWRRTQSAAGSTAGRTQADTLALGKQAVDTATGIVRDGSREAVLATLAATVVIGMLVGRRR